MVTLDKLDRRILGLLQADARRSSEEIAESVGLSATAVQRRIKRLRAHGVIRAEIAVVSAEAVGRRVTVLIEIELAAGSREDLVDDFKRHMAAQPEVQQCYYVSGEYDFLLVVTARDLADYERLTRRLFFGAVNVRKFRSIFVLDPVKVGLQLPVE